jgi:hypothetical protein
VRGRRRHKQPFIRRSSVSDEFLMVGIENFSPGRREVFRAAQL